MDRTKTKLDFETLKLVQDFFLKSDKFGKFIDWTARDDNPEATANEFVKLVDEFIETIYTYGFSDGHSLGLKEGKDIEDQLYAKSFE